MRRPSAGMDLIKGAVTSRQRKDILRIRENAVKAVLPAVSLPKGLPRKAKRLIVQAALASRTHRQFSKELGGVMSSNRHLFPASAHSKALMSKKTFHSIKKAYLPYLGKLIERHARAVRLALKEKKLMKAQRQMIFLRLFAAEQKVNGVKGAERMAIENAMAGLASSSAAGKSLELAAGAGFPADAIARASSAFMNGKVGAKPKTPTLRMPLNLGKKQVMVASPSVKVAVAAVNSVSKINISAMPKAPYGEVKSAERERHKFLRPDNTLATTDKHFWDQVFFMEGNKIKMVASGRVQYKKEAYQSNDGKTYIYQPGDAYLFVNISNTHQGIYNLEPLARTYREITGKKMKYLKLIPLVGKKGGRKYHQVMIHPVDKPNGRVKLGTPMNLFTYWSGNIYWDENSIKIVSKTK